jgi:hypothetical protein
MMAKHILRRSDTAKKIRPAGAKANNGYVLPAEKLEQREAVFVIYRDMGRARSLQRLARELKEHHPEIAVTRPALEKWSTQHQWAARVRQHDIAQDALPARAPTHPQFDGDFDQVDKLTSAAHMAITRALSGSVTVTKPSDMKTLVDAAANALKMAEAIRARQGDGASRDTIVAEITRILDLAEARRRMDAVDGLRAFGATEEQMLALGLTREDSVRVDMATPLPSAPTVVVDDEQVEIDPGPEPELEVIPEADLAQAGAKDIAVVAPQPGPRPTLFSDLMKDMGLSGGGDEE